MNKKIVTTLSVLFAAAALMGAGRGEGRTGARPAAARAVYHRRHVAVPAPVMPKPEHVVRDHDRAVYPSHDGAGAHISQSAAATPPAHHRTVVQNKTVVSGIQRQQRVEVVPNRYYWHNAGGVRYSHYYDGRNHWYGFYHGPTFYWTRYYRDRWWWYDVHGARWVFWWNGFWWWPGPGGAAYVYVDDAYYPYEGTGVAVEQAVTQAPPASVPVPDKGAATVSPDGSRLAQVFGADGQAFLYDNKTTPPTFLKYLGQGVNKIHFSGGTTGVPLQVLVEYKDDTFALFDGDGNSQTAAVRSAESTTAAPSDVPDSIPPAPTAAPGQ